MSLPEDRRKAPRVSAVVGEEIHTRLQAFAKQRNLSVAWVVRKALAEFLQNHSSDQGDLLLDE